MSTSASRIVEAVELARLSRPAPLTWPAVAPEAPPEGRSFAKLLTVGEVATILRVHPNRVYELAARRTLPAVRVGRLLRFDLGVLQQWIESGGTQTPNARHAPGRAVCRG